MLFGWRLWWLYVSERSLISSSNQIQAKPALWVMLHSQWWSCCDDEQLQALTSGLLKSGVMTWGSHNCFSIVSWNNKVDKWRVTYTKSVDLEMYMFFCWQLTNLNVLGAFTITKKPPCAYDCSWDVSPIEKLWGERTNTTHTHSNNTQTRRDINKRQK